MSNHNTSRSRRMVSLGKVTAPKPVNLPSQKKEQNNLMDVGAMFGGGSTMQSWGGMTSGGAQDNGNANENWNGQDHEAYEHEQHGHQMKNVQRVIPAQAQPAWGGAGLPEERVRTLELASREQFPTLGTDVDEGAKRERGGDGFGSGGLHGDAREGHYGDRDGGYYGDSREGYYRGHHRGGYGGGNSYYHDDQEGGRYGGRHGRRGGYGGGYDDRGYDDRSHDERGYDERGYGDDQGYEERGYGGYDQYHQFSHEGGEGGGEAQDVRESHGFQEERSRMSVVPPHEYGDRFGDRFDPRERYDRRHSGPQSPRFGRGYGRERSGYGGGPRNAMNGDTLSARGGYGRDDFYGRHGGRGGFEGPSRRRDDPHRGPYSHEDDVVAPEEELLGHRNGRGSSQAKGEGPKVPPPPPPRRAAAVPPPPPPGKMTASRDKAAVESSHPNVNGRTSAEERGDLGVQASGAAQVPIHPKASKGPVKVLKREPESLGLDIDLGTQISRPASRTEGSVDSLTSMGHTSPVLPSLEDLSISQPMTFAEDSAAAFDVSGPPGLFTSMVASDVRGHELHFPVAAVDHDVIHQADVEHHAESVAQLLDGFDEDNPGIVSGRQVAPAMLSGEGGKDTKVANHLPNIQFGDIVLPSSIDGCVPDSQSQSPHHKEFYRGRSRGRGGRGRGEPTNRGRGRSERGRGRGARGDRGRGGRGGRGRGEFAKPMGGGTTASAPNAASGAPPSAQSAHAVLKVPPPPPKASGPSGKAPGPSGASCAGPKKPKQRKPKKKFETKGESKGATNVENGSANTGTAEMMNTSGKAARNKEGKWSKSAPSPKGEGPPRTPAPPAAAVSTAEK